MDDSDEKRRGRNLGVAAGVGAFALGAAGVAALMRKAMRAKHDAPSGGSKIDAAGHAAAGGEESGGPSAASLDAGYELKDTRVRTLTIVMVVSVATIVVTTAGALFMYAYFDRHFAAADRDLTREQQATIVPPLPHLQAEPYRDIDAALMEQQQTLTTYGHRSTDPASAHIPIERAMQQVVGKPLDSPAQADASGAPGTTQHLPEMPAFPAAQSQPKPANSMQGEGRPGAVAPTDASTENAKGAKS